MIQSTRQLVLTVLLSKPDTAAHFMAWRTMVDLDDLPAEQNNLLPLLYHQLVGAQVEDVWMGRLKGVYRRTWYENILALKSLGELTQALNLVQVPNLVVGGACLAQAFYPEVSLRPIRAIDLVVPQAAIEKARQIAVKLGWRSTVSPRPFWDFGRKLWQSRLQFSNKTGQTLNLSGSFFPDLGKAGLDQAFWSQTQGFETHNLQIQTMNAAGHLLQACHSVYRSEPLALVDAALIVRSGQVDWTFFCEQAEHCRLVLPALHILTFLALEAGVPIPETCIARLSHQKQTWVARLIHKFGLIPPARRSLGARFILRIYRY